MRLISGQKFGRILALIFLPVVLLCVSVGPVSINIFELFFGSDGQSYATQILWDLRVPRVLLAAVVGAILAVAGALMQGLFRNPLADPSLIGVSAGASVGASLMIFFGVYTFAATNFLAGLSGLVGMSLVSLGAFLGGLIAAFVVYRLATHPERGTSVATMLLVGIAITALAAATNNLLSFLADNETLRRMSLWQMGNLDLANWHRFYAGIFAAVLLLFGLRGQASVLNAMLLGESEARHLGVNVEKNKRRLIFLSALGVGVATAIAGTIAFVGLIVPHMIRLISGPDHRALLPSSALLGAILLMLSDLLARVLLAPSELPVGVITAFLGVPFFLVLLRQQKYVR